MKIKKRVDREIQRYKEGKDPFAKRAKKEKPKEEVKDYEEGSKEDIATKIAGIKMFMKMGMATPEMKAMLAKLEGGESSGSSEKKEETKKPSWHTTMDAMRATHKLANAHKNNKDNDW